LGWTGRVKVLPTVVELLGRWSGEQFGQGHVVDMTSGEKLNG
jgi:hypothetical protein